MKNPMKIEYVRDPDGKVRRAIVIPPKIGFVMIGVFILMMYTQKFIQEKKRLKHFHKNYIVRTKIINFYGVPAKIVYVEPRKKKIEKTTENIEILTLDIPEEKEDGQN